MSRLPAELETLAQTLEPKIVVELTLQFVSFLKEARREAMSRSGKDAAAQREFAVRLRGTCVEFGAVRVADTCRSIERSVATNPDRIKDWTFQLVSDIGTEIASYNDHLTQLRRQYMPVIAETEEMNELSA